jgi:integrase/recombinase XerD
MTLSETIRIFLQHIEVVKNHSLNTVVGYTTTLTKFLEFVGDKEVGMITLSDVYNWRMYLSRRKVRGKPLSVKTQREYLVSIRSLLRYCHIHDITALSLEKIELPKVPETIVTFLSRDEVLRMFDAVRGPCLSDLRNTALLEALYSTGCRITELLNLDRDQIDLAARQFSVIGKGRKARLVFLSARAAYAIQSYLDAREDSLRPLFLDMATNAGCRDTGGRLSHWAAVKIVKKIAKKVGITKRVVCHTLRHSFATDLLENGADMRAVQELLGHASIRTTQIYAHVTNFHLKETFNKYHDKTYA